MSHAVGSLITIRLDAVAGTWVAVDELAHYLFLGRAEVQAECAALTARGLLEARHGADGIDAVRTPARVLAPRDLSEMAQAAGLA